MSTPLPQGVWDPILRTAWRRQKRRCAAPSVYVEALASLLLPRPAAARVDDVERVLLATDSGEAAATFPAAAQRALGVPLVTWVRPFDRSQLAHGGETSPSKRRGGGGGGKPTMRQWVEYRHDLGSDVVVSALEDLRMVS